MESQALKMNVIRGKKILPVVIGAAAGYLYYNFIGCVTGTCAITSNPWPSTIVGAVIGLMLMPKNKKLVQPMDANFFFQKC